MNYKIIVYCLIILFSISDSMLFAQEPTTEFKKGTEPNGFRGLKWGDNIYDHKDIINCNILSGGIDAVCVRQGDKMKIGTVPLEKVYYHFFENRFCDAIARYTGEVNYYRLLEILRLQYGIVFGMDNADSLVSLWQGKITEITLSYVKKGKYGMLVYESPTCQQYRKAKIKKDSTGDF